MVAASNNNATNDNSGHSVLVRKDTVLDMMGLYMDIHVIPPHPGDKSEERAFARMFARSYSRKAKDMLSADLVVFTGGSDVTPALYGEKPHATTFCDPERDEREAKLFEICVAEGIPMLGVCRGAQFLAVMHGGKLYQHVDGHNGNDHSIWDIRNKSMIGRTSSLHHQAVVACPELGMEVIADNIGVSQERWSNPSTVTKGHQADVEAYFFRDTCTLGIQGHPEYQGYHQYLQWTLKTIDDLIVCNPDVDFSGGNRRIKQSVRDEVKARRAELKLKELV